MLTLVLDTPPDSGDANPDQRRGEVTDPWELTRSDPERVKPRRRTFFPGETIRGHVEVLVREASDYEILTLEWRGSDDRRIDALTLHEGAMQPGVHSFSFEAKCPPGVLWRRSDEHYYQSIVAKLAASTEGLRVMDAVEYRLAAPEGAQPILAPVPAVSYKHGPGALPIVLRALLIVLPPAILVPLLLLIPPDWELGVWRPVLFGILAVFLFFAIRSIVWPIKALLATQAIDTFQAQVTQSGPRTLALDLRVGSPRLQGLEVSLVYEGSRPGKVPDPDARTRVAHLSGYRPVGERLLADRYELQLPPQMDAFGWTNVTPDYEQKWFVRVLVQLAGRPPYEHRIPLIVVPDLVLEELESSSRSKPQTAPSERQLPPAPPTWVHRLARHAASAWGVIGVWAFGVYYLGLTLGSNYVEDSGSFEEAAKLPFKPAGWWTFALGYGVPICVVLISLSRGAGLRANLRSLRFGGDE